MNTITTMQDHAKAKAYFEDKLAFTIGPVELKRLMKANEVNVIDVRDSEDFAEGHISGAINLPQDQWHTFEGLCKDKLNVLYSYSLVSHLAATAAVAFAAQDFPVMELEGGWRWWKENGFITASREFRSRMLAETCICGLTVGSCLTSNCYSHLVILEGAEA